MIIKISAAVDGKADAAGQDHEKFPAEKGGPSMRTNRADFGN